MRLRLLHVIITLVLGISCGALAQQSVGTPATDPAASSPPAVQGAPITQDNQPGTQQQEPDPAQRPVVLNPTQPPQEQHASRDRGETGKRVGAEEGAHWSNEAVIANFTIALAFATFLLMIATFGLWWETRKLAKQAKEASKDNKASIEIARRSANAAEQSAQASIAGINSQQAAIVFKKYIIGSGKNIIFNEVQYDQAMLIAIEWVNVGPTVAKDVAFHIQEIILSPGKTITEYDPNFPQGSTGFALGTGVSGQTDYAIVSHEIAVKLANKELVLHINSAAIYKTVQKPDISEIMKLSVIIDVTGIRQGPNGTYEYMSSLTVPMR